MSGTDSGTAAETAAAKPFKGVGDPVSISYGDEDEVALDVELPTTDKGIPFMPLGDDDFESPGASGSVAAAGGAASTASSAAAAAETGSNNGNPFDMLPDEVLIRIHGFLDPPSLGRVAQVSKRFYHLSHDLPMWKEISKRENWSRGGQSGLTRSFYVRKFLSFRRHEHDRAMQLQREARERRERRMKNRAVHALLWAGYARPYEWVMAISLLLFNIFCVLKWDHRVNWSWATVFIPLYIVLFQVVVLPLLYATMTAVFHDDFESDLEPEKTCRPLMFNLFFVQTMRSRDPTDYIHLLTGMGLLAWFVAMMIAKVAGAAAMSWAVTLIPLYLISIYLAIVPLTAGDGIWDDREWFDRLVLVPGGIMLFIFALFLGLRLDETILWSWQSVMIPLYCMDAYFTLLPMLLSFGNLCCMEDFMYNHSRWSDSASSFCFVSATIVVVLIVPLVVFEVMMAQNLDGTKDYRLASIFIPVFVVESLGICACAILNLVVMFD